MKASTPPPAKLTEVEAARWLKLREHHFESAGYQAAQAKRQCERRQAMEEEEKRQRKKPKLQDDEDDFDWNELD